MGLDPDFWSNRTRTLHLATAPHNSDFGSNQSPSLAWLKVQKTETLESQMNWDPQGTGVLKGESPDHASWVVPPLDVLFRPTK